MIKQHAEKNIDRIQFPTDRGKTYLTERGKPTKVAYGRLGNNWQNAEDCVQEAYLKVLEHPPMEMEEEHFENYFLTVVHSVASNMLRNDKQREYSCNAQPDRYKQYLELSIDEESDRNELIALVDGNSDPAEVALGDELRKRITEELTHVPFKYRNNIALYVIYGHKPKDVSIITGDTPKKVYNSIQYFRKHMRGELE